jgi:hypothetical protein
VKFESAYVSIRQHTSAASGLAAVAGCPRRQHTSAYVSIRQHTQLQGWLLWLAARAVSIRQHTSAYVSIRSFRAGCCGWLPAPLAVSIRQHTSAASVSIRQHTSAASGLLWLAARAAGRCKKRRRKRLNFFLKGLAARATCRCTSSRFITRTWGGEKSSHAPLGSTLPLRAKP